MYETHRYTSLLRICCTRSDMEEARRLFSEMRECGQIPRLRTFIPLLEAYATAGDVERTFDVHTQIVQAGLVLGERE